MRAKKNIIRLLILLSFLMGCARPPADTLTITMSLGEDEWKVFREEVFPLFEKAHNIKIKAYQIESSQLAMKLEALQSAGKSEIDLFAQDNMNLALLVKKGLVSDLSQYEDTIPAEVREETVQACKFGDKLLFMPFRINVQIAYYNEDAFGKYGLVPPRNWKELLRVAANFFDREGTGRVLIKAFGGNATATQIYEFVMQAGGDPYSFNDEGCVRAFEFLQALAPYMAVESTRAKWDTTNGILARGDAYLAQNWPFGIVILVKRFGLENIKTYSGWEGPAGEYHVLGGDVFGIPKNSEKKNLALKFITYMQSREVQEILVSELAWPSIRDDAYARVDDWQRPYFESVREALNHGVFRKNVSWWPVYAKYVNEAFREIVMKSQPAKGVLDEYKKKLESEKS